MAPTTPRRITTRDIIVTRIAVTTTGMRIAVTTGTTTGTVATTAPTTAEGPSPG